MQIHRFAGHHVDGLTPNGTRYLHLIQGIDRGDAGHEAQGWFLPDDHGHLHRFVFFEVLIIVLSDMLAGGVELDTGLLVVVHHHHPVGSAVHPTRFRVLGDHRVKGSHQSPAVSLVPVRDGHDLQVDIVSQEYVVLDGASFDDPGGDVLGPVVDAPF